MKILLLCFLSLFVFTACAKNPVSKKDEFVLMSEADELALGRQYAPIFTKQYGGELKNPELQAYVTKLGQSLADNADRPELFYRFTVLDSPIVNAFALPGGYIFVTRGLLAAVNSETELAGVLGHEIGHVTARHSVAQYTKAQSYQILATAASILVPGAENFSQLADIMAMGVMSGFGRENEMQSDSLAVKYLAKSNYDPHGMPSFLSTLAVTEEGKKEGETFEGFFASHPDTKVRIEASTKLANATDFPRDPVRDRKLQDIYFSKIEGLPFGESSSEGFFLANHFYHPELKFEIVFPENWYYFNEPERVIAKNQNEKREGKNKTTPIEKATLFCEFSLLDLQKRVPLRTTVDEIFANAGIKPERIWADTINGREAYVAIYDGNNRGMKDKKKITAFVASGPTLYLITGFASGENFYSNFGLFERYYKSFRILSDSEAQEIKPPHIHIYTVQPGDTFENLAEKFYKDSKKAKTVSQINGMRLEEKLVPGQKIKVITLK